MRDADTLDIHPAETIKRIRHGTTTNLEQSSDLYSDRSGRYDWIRRNLALPLSRWSERRRCLRPDVHFGDAFVGIPIILVENVIGRRGQANSIDAFLPDGSKYSPLWKFFGYTGILGAFGILSYYMPLGGWVITYIYHLILGLFGIEGGLDLSSPVTKELTSTFYHANIEQAPLMITICTAVFVLINWVILRKGIIAGIERSVKFLMPLLFSASS